MESALISDFYSGFVYNMLIYLLNYIRLYLQFHVLQDGAAHRIEELVNAGKIIRPSYMNVMPKREYLRLDERK